MTKISDFLLQELNEKEQKEVRRNIEMARHFMDVMIDTGFTARDVALAFIKAGVDLKMHVGGKELTKSLLSAIQELVDRHSDEAITQPQKN